MGGNSLSLDASSDAERVVRPTHNVQAQLESDWGGGTRRTTRLLSTASPKIRANAGAALNILGGRPIVAVHIRPRVCW